jgi:hypothetical protein
MADQTPSTPSVLPADSNPPAELTPSMALTPSINDIHDLYQLAPLPSEVILKIFENLPLSSIYNFAKTNQSFRNLLKTHERSICNAKIQAQFLKPSEIFKSEVIDGWLMPQPYPTGENQTLFSAK